MRLPNLVSRKPGCPAKKEKTMEWIVEIAKNWPQWIVVAFGIVIAIHVASIVLLEDA